MLNKREYGIETTSNDKGRMKLGAADRKRKKEGQKVEQNTAWTMIGKWGEGQRDAREKRGLGELKKEL
ncbi:hypothetical protein DPMN_031483 [Dreissena polymorpha]|uniref:Uncharacterized protein n=1 Tax=Dreissena polymorpha TaxID=45954 RepID=A0A9D4M024_DREPO|nr:hypothetical protein DPMN_031483 [Dreissena polymorpha]